MLTKSLLVIRSLATLVIVSVVYSVAVNEDSVRVLAAPFVISLLALVAVTAYETFENFMQ